MKKIGVITFHKASNYGAFLQCYALQEALKKLGHSSSVIDYETPADIERYKMVSTKSIKAFIKSLLFLPYSIIRKKHFSEALETINFTKVNEDYDIAITGSDQVWNANLSGGKLDDYFTLRNVNARKKISYAASIGDETAVVRYPQAFRELVSNLNAISVRENQAKKALSAITSKKIFVAIDPTALLAREQWEKYIKESKPNNQEYIFSYFIGITSKQAKALAKICESLNLKTISYSMPPKEKHILKHCYTDGPFTFLSRLRDAKLVITSSFHGTILSIIFCKNFYVLMPNPKKRSRIDNILELVGLTDRIIETEDDLAKVNLKSIDFTEPQKKLDKLREKSLNWLEETIGD